MGRAERHASEKRIYRDSADLPIIELLKSSRVKNGNGFKLWHDLLCSTSFAIDGVERVGALKKCAIFHANVSLRLCKCMFNLHLYCFAVSISAFSSQPKLVDSSCYLQTFPMRTAKVFHAIAREGSGS